MTSPPPTLLTLPLEIRSNIFHLALRNSPEVRSLDPPYRFSLDLSLLSTNRQVYYETRAIPLALHYFGKQYDPKINFLSSLRLRPFQIAALKTLDIEYLYPGDLTYFLELGRENGYLFGEEGLDLDLLVISADDWIAGGTRRWRPTTSAEDVHYDLPKSSRWLRALCGLKGWKQLEVVFKEAELVNEYWSRNGFMQTLFDDFRSRLEDFDEDFTIWHESHDVWYEKITVLRTKELGRYKQPMWPRADVGRLMEGRECILGGSMDMNEDERARPAFHVQESFGHPSDPHSEPLLKQDSNVSEETALEYDSREASLLPYLSPSTDHSLPVGPVGKHNALSTRDDSRRNLTSTWHIVFQTWPVFVPAPDAASGLSQMYRQMYAAAVNASLSVAPSVRLAFTYGAFTLTMTAVARVIPWDVVLALSQCMMAGIVCCGVCSILLPMFAVVWVVLGFVELTFGVRQSLDVLLAGLDQ